MSIFMHRIRSDRQLRGKSGLGKINRSRIRRDARFGLDRLEDRRLLSNYMVTNTNYSGADSLGGAIAAAISSDDSHAQIDFVLPDRLDDLADRERHGPELRLRPNGLCHLRERR